MGLLSNLGGGAPQDDSAQQGGEQAYGDPQHNLSRPMMSPSDQMAKTSEALKLIGAGEPFGM